MGAYSLFHQILSPGSSLFSIFSVAQDQNFSQISFSSSPNIPDNFKIFLFISIFICNVKKLFENFPVYSYFGSKTIWHVKHVKQAQPAVAE